MNISHTIEKINQLIAGTNHLQNNQHCGNTGPSEYSEGPRDAALIIDTSYSMLTEDWRPCRLNAAQAASQTYVERLLKEEPSARISIIAYGSNAKLVMPLTPVHKIHILKKAINSIRAKGNTNMASGLNIACDQLKNGYHTKRAVLLTDGRNNAGEDPRKFAEILKKYAVIDCIGIGGNRLSVDEPLLKSIASSYPDGSKRYRWIGDKQKLVRHFHNLAGGLVRAK